MMAKLRPLGHLLGKTTSERRTRTNSTPRKPHGCDFVRTKYCSFPVFLTSTRSWSLCEMTNLCWNERPLACMRPSSQWGCHRLRVPVSSARRAVPAQYPVQLNLRTNGFCPRNVVARRHMVVLVGKRKAHGLVEIGPPKPEPGPNPATPLSPSAFPHKQGSPSAAASWLTALLSNGVDHRVQSTSFGR